MTTTISPLNKGLPTRGQDGSFRTGVHVFLAVVVGAGVQSSMALPPSRLVEPSPGGIDPRPIILSVTNDAEGRLQATCGGFQGGPFQVEVCTNLAAGGWASVGPAFTNNVFTLELTNLAPARFYRVRGPAPFYAAAAIGNGSCAQCHSVEYGGTRPWDIWYDHWRQTPHARAYATLTNDNPANGTNASCLPCHTVGFGYPGGYTPGNTALQGVQCENCHGPGGVRHRTYLDRRPAIEWSAMLCGGCHTTAHHPTYEEWKSSGHGRSNPEVASLFRDPDEGLANQHRCGSCHSGAMRAYLLVPTGGDMPDGVEAGREGIVCVGCHDPHANTAAGHQVRNPLFSTNAYSVTPATNWAGFFQQYQNQVNLCGQCHNARGAAWTDTLEPPHRSPQYNMMLGAIGELESGAPPYQPAAHALLIQNQCVGCHMPSKPYQGETQPAVTGHAFKVSSFDGCLACHPLPELLTEFTVAAVSNQVQQVKALLDQWAATAAPEPLRSKYGSRAWEYTRPGALSNPAGVTNGGPTSVEQALIPAAVRKARFNLYLVFGDGSFGVHNAPYIVGLLEAARNWVRAELD